MAEYTAAEYTDMLITYGMADCNAAEAVRMYSLRHPNRRHPCARTFLRLVNRSRKTGNLLPNHREAGAPRNARNVENEEAIIAAVEDNPEIGIQGVVEELHLSYGTVQRTLKLEKLHGYHYQRVQELRAEDFPIRLAFCREILHRLDNNEFFIDKILFTDESTFGRNNFWNTRTFHWYARENPHCTVVQNHQERFSINIWAGLHFGQRTVVGPHEFQDNLTAAVYVDFLENHLQELCNETGIQCRQYRRMWFQQDGAPAHTAGVSQAWLHASFKTSINRSLMNDSLDAEAYWIGHQDLQISIHSISFCGDT
ncbi:uncharacterized protein LOC141529286 [Cotesia typhae]|uniref:uncharacterized protein LOC141529286 n=1 Tax=Cotesia typhae TaxID=2053667 RepID=UPI003D681D17